MEYVHQMIENIHIFIRTRCGQPLDFGRLLRLTGSAYIHKPQKFIIWVHAKNIFSIKCLRASPMSISDKVRVAMGDERSGAA